MGSSIAVLSQVFVLSYTRFTDWISEVYVHPAPHTARNYQHVA